MKEEWGSQVKLVKKVTFFVSFVEEYYATGEEADIRRGRIEVYVNIPASYKRMPEAMGLGYANKEIRFSRKADETYFRIRDMFDFKELSLSSYLRMIRIVKLYLR